LSKNQKTNELNEQQKEQFKAWKRKEVERHDANFAMQSKRLMVGTIARIAKNMHNMMPSIFHTSWILEGVSTLPRCF
jgi:hypothetical protein